MTRSVETVSRSVVAEGWCGRRFRFTSLDGAAQSEADAEAHLNLSLWKEAATLSVGEHTFALTRLREVERPWVLTSERDGRVLAQAIKPSAWRSGFTLHVGSETMHLRPRNLWLRTFELWHGDVQIGAVTAQGWLSRRARLDLPEDWPLPLGAFAFFLVRLMWNRQSAAAAT